MDDTAAGGLGGAASGASAGAGFGPIGIAAGGLVGGAIGLLTARKRAAEAKRLAQINNGLAYNDTAFGGFRHALDRGHEVGGVSDSAPSALGSTLQGALAGVQQGMNVYDGLRKMRQPQASSPGMTLGTPQAATSDNGGSNSYGDLLQQLRGLV